MTSKALFCTVAIYFVFISFNLILYIVFNIHIILNITSTWHVFSCPCLLLHFLSVLNVLFLGLTYIYCMWLTSLLNVCGFCNWPSSCWVSMWINYYYYNYYYYYYYYNDTYVFSKTLTKHNLLKTKYNLLYIKYQSVQLSKHFQTRL